MLLASCMPATTTPPPPRFSHEEISYTSLRIDARHLKIIENWQMPGEDPYVEHHLSPNLSDMVVAWASTALVPVGGSGELFIDITEASVQVTDLPRSTDMIDVFRDQQTLKVQATIIGKLMWLHPAHGKQGILDMHASAATMVKESARPSERESMIHDMMVQAVNHLDAEMRANITSIDGILHP